jgi:hypothetical protein|tara:strand:- start:465 stop:614 length:150 start_codon:yes stop_codon:yes gene_type:complete
VRAKTNVKLNLDAVHMKKLRDPQYIMDFSLVIPEGMAADPKKALANVNT